MWKGKEMIEKYTKIFINAIFRWVLFSICVCLIWCALMFSIYFIDEVHGFNLEKFGLWICGMFTYAFIDSLKGKTDD